MPFCFPCCHRGPSSFVCDPLLNEEAMAAHVENLQDRINEDMNLESRNRFDETSLYHALDSGHIQCMELLLRSGAEVHARNGMGQEKAFTLAARNCNLAALRILRQFGAVMDDDEEINELQTAALQCQDDGKHTVEPVYAKELSPKDAENEFQARVYATTGTANQQVGLRLLTKASEALTKSSDSIDETVHHLNSIAKTMQALKPQDEIEGQLISQLIILHEQSMLWLGKAIRTQRVDFVNAYMNAASKLLTRHHETLATLMKYRRGGEQRVHVEHVHIHEGAQAIVGNVGTGGGLNQKFEEGPHAKM